MLTKTVADMAIEIDTMLEGREPFGRPSRTLAELVEAFKNEPEAFGLFVGLVLSNMHPPQPKPTMTAHELSLFAAHCLLIDCLDNQEDARYTCIPGMPPVAIKQVRKGEFVVNGENVGNSCGAVGAYAQHVANHLNLPKE